MQPTDYEGSEIFELSNYSVLRIFKDGSAIISKGYLGDAISLSGSELINLFFILKEVL